jgi:hypothetical protein
MAQTGGFAGASRLGERPAAAVSTSGCTGCGHPFALHGNGKTTCRAFACRKGPHGQPCQGFAGRAYGDDYLVVPDAPRLAS